MDNRDIIERTALEPIKLHPQLGCWPTCRLRVGGSRRDNDAAGDNGTATRSVVEITGRQLGSIALGAGAARRGSSLICLSRFAAQEAGSSDIVPSAAVLDS